MLGLRRELADRHVLDHAPAQRAYCLVGHGDAPVLSEGCEPLISRQDAPLRYRLGCAASRSLLPRERFSSLTPTRTIGPKLLRSTRFAFSRAKGPADLSVFRRTSSTFLPTRQLLGDRHYNTADTTRARRGQIRPPFDRPVVWALAQVEERLRSAACLAPAAQLSRALLPFRRGRVPHRRSDAHPHQISDAIEDGPCGICRSGRDRHRRMDRAEPRVRRL